MKTIYCTCNVSILESITKLINDLGVKSYQVFEMVLASSLAGDPRFNTAVWPGYNASVIMQVETPELASLIMESIRNLNRRAFNPNELVMATMWTVDDFCFD